MLGMLIAVLATLFSVNFFTSNIQTIGLVLIAIVIGGLIGSVMLENCNDCDAATRCCFSQQ